MLGTDLHERMQGAGGDVKTQALMEEQSDFTICPTLPPQLADQLTVRFEF